MRLDSADLTVMSTLIDNRGVVSYGLRNRAESNEAGVLVIFEA